MIEIVPILVAACSGALYSFVFYAKKRAGKSPQDFDPFKLVSTVIIGMVVGIGLQLSGTNLTQEAVSSQVAVYAGTVALLESLLKTVYRQFLEDYISEYSK